MSDSPNVIERCSLPLPCSCRNCDGRSRHLADLPIDQG